MELKNKFWSCFFLLLLLLIIMLCLQFRSNEKSKFRSNAGRSQIPTSNVNNDPAPVDKKGNQSLSTISENVSPANCLILRSQIPKDLSAYGVLQLGKKNQWDFPLAQANFFSKKHEHRLLFGISSNGKIFSLREFIINRDGLPVPQTSPDFAGLRGETIEEVVNVLSETHHASWIFHFSAIENSDETKFSWEQGSGVTTCESLN